jgi:hypothetical protein
MELTLMEAADLEWRVISGGLRKSTYRDQQGSAEKRTGTQNQEACVLHRLHSSGAFQGSQLLLSPALAA